MKMRVRGCSTDRDSVSIPARGPAHWNAGRKMDHREHSGGRGVQFNKPVTVNATLRIIRQQCGKDAALTVCLSRAVAFVRAHACFDSIVSLLASL